MELSSEVLATVTEVKDVFTSTTSVIPDATEVILDTKLEPIGDSYLSALNIIDGGASVGLEGFYVGVFDTEIWYFPEGDVVSVDYPEGGGKPIKLSDEAFEKLKEKYPDSNVVQPTVTDNPLSIPEGQTIFAYFQSTNLTKIVKYSVTVDYYIDDAAGGLFPPVGIDLDQYQIEDYENPPGGIIRSIFTIQQTVNGDLATPGIIINKYYGNKL